MVIIASVAIALASACSNGSSGAGVRPSNGATGQRADKVRITTLQGSLLALPQYVAQDLGFFSSENLDVTSVPTASGPQALQALVTGGADLMLNSPDFLLQANDKGQSIKFVVGNTRRGITTLIARRGWPLPHQGSYPEAVHDLKGARIGVTARGSGVENQLRLMLRAAGLDPDKDVTIVATGLVDTAIASLQTGQVDAWVGFEPGTTIALEQLQIGTAVVDLRAGQGPELLVNYETNAYAATSAYIAKHDAIVRRFVAAMKKAQDWLANPANRARLATIVAAHVKIDESLIPKMLEGNLSTFGAAIPESNIESAITLMENLKLITGRPSYADLVATKYVPAS